MIIETERLLLRNLQSQDKAKLFELIFSQADVMAYLPYGRVLTEQESNDFIDQYFPTEQTQTGLFIAESKQTKELVGFAGCVPFTELGQEDAEFGFGFGKAYWNHGYGSEIASAFIKYILDEVKYPRFMALVYPDNKPSIHVLEKLGYQYIDTMTLPNRSERRVYFVDHEHFIDPQTV